jgi:hypothetical protein
LEASHGDVRNLENLGMNHVCSDGSIIARSTLKKIRKLHTAVNWRKQLGHSNQPPKCS